MSELFKQILFLPAGGVAKLEIRKYANLQSVYSLCSSVENKSIIVALSSTATLSMLLLELISQITAAGVSLCVTQNNDTIASISSAYSLSTAPP